MLGSLNDMLDQQQNVNTLNAEIATGQSLLSASTNPAGAANVLNTANTIAQYNYDLTNANAATQSPQNGVSSLQQVTTLLDSLQQTALQAGRRHDHRDLNRAVARPDRPERPSAQLDPARQCPGRERAVPVQRHATPALCPTSLQPNGQVKFNGDAGSNQIQIAPSLSVPSSMSGQFRHLHRHSGRR